MKETILKLLKNEKKKHNLFYSGQSTPMEDINVSIQGIGDIHFPLTQQTIEIMLGYARKAKFGKADQTLYDESVRDTHEIPLNALTVTIDNIEALMKNISNDMGIKSPLKLQPHLHNMLIYKKGQFFKAHQDTEKLEGMVATMVVVLPSAHIGGTLNVTHKGQTQKFKSESIYPKSVSYFSFYADCEHEVDVVTDGYRVVLTYNLVLEQAEKENQAQLENFTELKTQIVDYMNNNESFIYFLDHEYTEHSLRFRYLKGGDRLNVQALCRIAKEEGYKVHLSLVDIQKIYDAPEEDEINDLIDDTTELYHWIDSNDHLNEYERFCISEDDVFQLKSTESFEPEDEEYEGFLGNYGCTMSYWYNRAAFIMWKDEDQLRFEFKLMKEKSLANLEKMIEDKKPKQDVCAIVQAVYPILLNRYNLNFKNAAQIVSYIENEDIAKEIMNTFRWKDLEEENLESLKKIEIAYGEKFLFDLVNAWGTDRFFYAQLNSMKNFIKSINHVQFGDKTTEFILAKYAYNFFQNTSDNKIVDENKKHEVSLLIDIIHLFLDITQKFPELLKEIQKQILGKNYPLPILFEIIKNNGAFLKETILEKMNYILEKGRPEDCDWEIEKQISCTCKNCQDINTFLKSKTDQTFILAQSEQYRGHVERHLNGLYLPIKMSTLKNKRPYQLVIEKQEETYKARQALYDKVCSYTQK